MNTKVLFLLLSALVFGFTLLYTGSQPSSGNGFSKLDRELADLLTSYGYTGRIQEQLEHKLGRKLDPKKIELGRLIFFDKGLAWHQDNSCAGCHAPAVGFGDSQFMAIGVENNDVVGKTRQGPRNQRRSPMIINTGFYPALMWNGRFFSNTDDPFDNSKGFTFPAPEADTFFRANDPNISHLLVAQAHIPFTELPEMAGFRNAPVTFNVSKFQGFLLTKNQTGAKKVLINTPLFVNGRPTSRSDNKRTNTSCEPYDVAIFSDDDTGFPLPPFENSFVNFPIRKKTIELINGMPEYRRLFAKIYPQSAATGIEFYMIGQAIAEFELFLTFAKAPIDKFARGNYQALTNQEKRGAILFFKKGNCISCHSIDGSSNEMFSDFKMHNIGIPQLTPTFGIETGNVGFATSDATLCKNGIYDLGRFEFDGLEESKFLFRTSPLRNVGLQPAFFHNGAFNNLKAAVVYHLNPIKNSKKYNPRKNGIPDDVIYQEAAMPLVLESLDNSLLKGIELTNAETNDLVAFLSTGLLDPGARPEKLAKLIPKSLPSGAGLPEFESDRSTRKTFDSPAPVQSLLKPTDEAAVLQLRGYPNPFIDQTTIEYSLSVSSRVRYTLSDSKGRIVRQLQNTPEQPAGHYRIQIDGSNLPVGQYLYRLQAGSQNRTMRLIKK